METSREFSRRPHGGQKEVDGLRRAFDRQMGAALPADWARSVNALAQMYATNAGIRKNR